MWLKTPARRLLSTHVGLQSDYVIYSPRKTLGVPDGGILQYKRDHFPEPVELMPTPKEWWLKTLEACIARREFDKFGGDRKWYELFRHSGGNISTWSLPDERVIGGSPSKFIRLPGYC